MHWLRGAVDSGEKPIFEPSGIGIEDRSIEAIHHDAIGNQRLGVVIDRSKAMLFANPAFNGISGSRSTPGHVD